jgi:hypothetical protein
MSLSRNEMNTIKKAIKESIQAYVDIKIANAQYAFTEIATVTKENWDDLSNDIEVKGKATYTHVISVGKIVYPVGSVVYCFIPNNQYNNMFILGKLDKVPAQITGGTIGIGRIGTTEPPQYNFYVDSDGNVTINKGSINLGNGNFVVDNRGNVTINQGSIHLGWNGSGYNFSVENDGEMTAYNGTFVGSVTATSGEIGKFKISVTDGLLEYEDPTQNKYLFLGKSIKGACGFYVQDREYSCYTSITSLDIAVADANFVTSINAYSILIADTSNNYILLEPDKLSFANSGALQNIGEIEFTNGLPIRGADDDLYFEKRGTQWIANGNGDYHLVPTCSSVGISFKNVKTCIDEKYNELSNNLGITVELSGDVTLSTSPTSGNFLSNTTGGKHTVSYGHSLSLPASGHTSDIRLKEQISEMPNIEDLYNQIKLYKFKYHSDIVDADDRFHWGIIAQEVDELFQSNGYTDKDFSLVYKSKQNVGYNEDKYVGDDKVFRVLPNEFNAMHVQMIQKLWKRCDALEKEIEQLKQERNDK